MFFLRYIVNYLKRHYRVDRGAEFVEALRRLNRPSEVTVPNELIPAGVLMQLRGLLNLHVLSVNSDWVWPYWIEQQINPAQSRVHSPRRESDLPESYAPKLDGRRGAGRHAGGSGRSAGRGDAVDARLDARHGRAQERPLAFPLSAARLVGVATA